MAAAASLRLVRYHPASPVELPASGGGMLSWPARLVEARSVEELRAQLPLPDDHGLLLVLVEVAGQRAWLELEQLPGGALPAGPLHLRYVRI